jgi:hypothetical protein
MKCKVGKYDRTEGRKEPQNQKTKELKIKHLAQQPITFQG